MIFLRQQMFYFIIFKHSHGGKTIITNMCGVRSKQLTKYKKLYFHAGIKDGSYNTAFETKLNERKLTLNEVLAKERTMDEFIAFESII